MIYKLLWGISQLKRLQKIVNERNKQLKLYKELLKDLPLTFLDIPNDVFSSVHLGVIKLEDFQKMNIEKFSVI